MENSTLIILFLVLAILVGLCFVYYNKHKKTAATTENNIVAAPANPEEYTAEEE